MLEVNRKFNISNTAIEITSYLLKRYIYIYIKIEEFHNTICDDN